jgi:hypothetical protein
MNDAPKPDPQITGNVGLYYCCYQLSLRGWNVMPTARNARGVDLIAYDSAASKITGVQVKALSKRNPVPVGSSLSKVMGDYWVVVNNIYKTPKAYILRPADVKKLALRTEKDGKVSFWLEPKKYDSEEFLERWERIGHGHATTVAEVP